MELDSFPGTVVLAVGDAMLDEYVWGEVDRISPEAPVPVVNVVRRTDLPGGAANVAAGLVALEGKARVCGVVGDDEAGHRLRRQLEAAGVDVTGLIVDPSRPTTTKSRVIAHNQQVVRTDFEDRSALSESVEREVAAAARALVADSDAVVVSDYAKGVVSDTVARAVIEEAHRTGRPVVVDPKGVDYAKYRGATIITPNARDAGRAANVHVDEYNDLVEAARRLSEASDGALLLITRGADGMTLFASDGAVDIPTDAKEVYDVTGAGDTVAAVLGMALGSAVPVEDAVRIANAAAGITVAKLGTSTVTLDELRRA
jgi:D-beta-D-heptose 7-phosphate kinase/D-beta-D-heptose 1-phosphate adenosyltransferase